MPILEIKHGGFTTSLSSALQLIRERDDHLLLPFELRLDKKVILDKLGLVNEKYQRIIDRNFATLERTEEEREKCSGTKWQGGTGLHLKESFALSFDATHATVVNTSPYASNHQNGERVPRRPFMPVDEDGNLMPFMWSRIKTILDVHFEV